MGRPKIKIIDDSQLEEAKEKPSHKKAEKAKSETTNEGRLSPNAASSRVDEVDRTRGDEPQGAVPQQRDAVSEQESGIADQSQKPKKPQKPGKTKPRSKKYQEAAKDLDRNKLYPLIEAIDLAKKVSYSKNNTTLEAHINTATLGIRGLVSLPFASGRKLRIIAFGPSTALRIDNSDELPDGVIMGTDETIEEINQGKINFDLCLTTPDWMPKLAKIARILGPKGLMPNPKNGTIVSGADGLKKAIEGFQAGKTEYKTESKAPVIHIVMGKLDQPTEELSANIKTLVQTLGKTRVKKITLAPTMGPGVKVDLTSL